MSPIAFGRDFPSDYEAIVGGQVERRRVNFQNTLEAHATLQGVSVVVQLVNSSSPGMANQRVVSDIEVNVIPHVAFIESCVMANVKYYIFLSSGGTVYGDPKSIPINEEHPTEPLNSYGMTKLMVEQYLRIIASGSDMHFASLRVSNPFGPGQEQRRGQGLIPAVLSSHERGLPISVFGDGANQRDYIFIDDLMDAIIACLKSNPIDGAVNIGSGRGHSILDVISEIERNLDVKLQRIFLPSRPTDATSNILDISKAHAALCWRPKISFEVGLQKTVADFYARDKLK